MYRCQVCNKPFNIPSDRSKHEQYHKSPTHPCQHCERAFTLPKDLRRHMKTHDAQRPRFFCPIANCPRSQAGLARADGLKKHMEAKHAQASIQSASGQALWGKLSTASVSVLEIMDDDDVSDEEEEEEEVVVSELPSKSTPFDESSAMLASTRSLSDGRRFVQQVDPHPRTSNAIVEEPADAMAAAEALIKLSKHTLGISSKQD